MKTNLSLLVAIIALAAVTAWIGMRSSNPPAPANVKLGARSPQPSAPVTANALVLETPGEPAQEAQTPPAQADGARTAAAVEKVGFEAKYAGWSLEQLTVANTETKQAFNRASNDVLEQRARDGKTDELILKAGESAPPITALVSRRTSESAGEGLVRLRTVTVPLDDYPDLKSLYEEMVWLNGQTRTLSKPAKH